MLQLENLGSVGISNHPVLGELGLAMRALVSTTGVECKGACPVAGEMSLCLIMNRAMSRCSLRACDFCDLSKKQLIIQKLLCMSMLAPQVLCSWLSASAVKGPDVAWWHLSSSAHVSRENLIRVRNSSGPEIVIRAAGECLIWTHGLGHGARYARR